MFFREVDKSLKMALASEECAEELCRVVLENFDYLNEWMPWAKAGYNLETARRFLKKKVENFALETEIALIIFDENRLVGVISIFKIDSVNRSGEIGYWVAKGAQGNGIATKCSKELINYAFDELNLNRIVIRCATENIKSQAIPERLGFTEEGVSRQVEWLHNRFTGLAVYSILKEEWENI